MTDEEMRPRLCFDRVLPLELQAEAERVAAAENPANVRPSDQRLALLNRKCWAVGKRLRVRFLDGSPALHKRVEAVAQEWTRYANLTLDFGDHADAHIRVSFEADPGSWSAVGTDALVTRYFKPHEPTMNLGWLREDSPDAELSVVLHEFGHALGAIHEHQTPIGGLRWREDKVLKYFSGPPNFWDEATIRHNVLEQYSLNSLRGSDFDPDSIMLYAFPGSLFQNGVGTRENHSLSALDKALIAEVYPR